MDRRSVENMKLDQRLIGRRGWISEKDLQRALDALPDVSDKIASDEPDPESPTETSAEAAPVAALQTEQPLAEPAISPQPSAPAAFQPAPAPPASAPPMSDQSNSETGFSSEATTAPGDPPDQSGPSGSDSPLT